MHALALGAFGNISSTQQSLWFLGGNVPILVSKLTLWVRERDPRVCECAHVINRNYSILKWRYFAIIYVHMFRGYSLT